MKTVTAGCGGQGPLPEDDVSHAERDILVSIVIDNYNYGRFLADAISSAIGQTYPHTEIIVVDDGSTDCSREVIGRFAGRITPVLKENGGQASAFNAGFAASRGDVVIFLDADDELLPETAGRVAAAIRTNPGVAKVMYRMEVIDSFGAPTGLLKPAQHLLLRSGDIRRHTQTFPYDLTWMATSGNAFPARVLHQIFPIPEEAYRRGADWYLAPVSTLYGPVLFLEEIGACYRVHGENGYEVSSFDLKQIHKSIGYMLTSRVHIAEAARRLGLDHAPEGPEDVLSVSFAANRLVSLKLDPRDHPIGGDNVWRALSDGFRATGRRFDTGPLMKAIYLVWFVMTAAAPGPLARRLAELFFFPEKRPRVNGLLGLLHRRNEHKGQRSSHHYSTTA